MSDPFRKGDRRQGEREKVLGEERHHLELHQNQSCAVLLRPCEAGDGFQNGPACLGITAVQAQGPGSAAHAPRSRPQAGSLAPARPSLLREPWAGLGRGVHNSSLAAASSPVFPLRENCFTLLSAASCRLLIAYSPLFPVLAATPLSGIRAYLDRASQQGGPGPDIAPPHLTPTAGSCLCKHSAH